MDGPIGSEVQSSSELNASSLNPNHWLFWIFAKLRFQDVEPFEKSCRFPSCVILGPDPRTDFEPKDGGRFHAVIVFVGP